MLSTVILVVSLALAAHAHVSVPMEPVRFPSAHHAALFHTQKLRTLAQQLGISPNVSLPMGGDIYPLGIYWTKIALGTPATQIFKVAIDTGSCTLVVPEAGCQGCATAANRFDPQKSSSITDYSCSMSRDCTNSFCNGQQCDFSNTYQTCNLMNPNKPCTISGKVFYDYFDLGGLKAKSTIGAITYQTPHFQQLDVVDGILGMACETSFDQPIPLYALADKGLIKKVFSFCFRDRNHGILNFGGYNPKWIAGPIMWMPLVGSSFAYILPLNGMGFDGQSKLNVPARDFQNHGTGGAILDSGTNILLLPDVVFSSLQAAFYTACSGQSCSFGKALFSGKCLQLSVSQIYQFPTIVFYFDGGSTLKQTPDTYVVEDKTRGGYCLGIKNTGVGGFLIVGDTLMWNYVTILDRDNGRSGWAPVAKSKCQ